MRPPSSSWTDRSSCPPRRKSTPGAALILALIAAAEPVVRPLEERDLADADRVFRLAFGTFIGLPDPMTFSEGAEPLRCRFAAGSGIAFAAEMDGELVGSAFLSRWGSFAPFGPLTVHPDYWGRGIGQLLWATCPPVLEEWGATHAGLFTFPQSTMHVHLYRKFGFWPRFLTAITTKPVPPPRGHAVERYSELPEKERRSFADRCRALTDAIYPGLDLERELRAPAERPPGDVVFVGDEEDLAGFAVCHAGAGSEAGTATCYVKFAAARGGDGAAERFDRLLEAVEELAARAGLSRVEAGVNLAREGAFGVLAARGYRTSIQGLAMHRPNDAGYDTPDAFVIDDWR